MTGLFGSLGTATRGMTAIKQRCKPAAITLQIPIQTATQDNESTCKPKRLTI